jgi:hypothetical protein
MPLHSLLMGITSFAPERHIRMYAITIPEKACAVKSLSNHFARPQYRERSASGPRVHLLGVIVINEACKIVMIL